MKPMIFLDDGGVLSDNERRAPQWRRHVGTFLAGELGGDPEAWGEANRVAFERAWARFTSPARRTREPREFVRSDGRVWLVDMCRELGLDAPPLESMDDIVARAGRYVTERVRAFYPEATEALRALHARGHVLHTASNQTEADLNGYLRAEGVRELFTNLYGADVVNVWKDSPDYYRAIFAHAGVDPRNAVVVDDGPKAVAWARGAGALAFLMARTGGADDRGLLRSLADLLQVLD